MRQGRLLLTGFLLGLAVPVFAREGVVNEVVDPWAVAKPAAASDDAKISTAACAQKINPAAAEMLSKASDQEKMNLLRGLGVPPFLYMRPKEGMINESFYSFAGASEANKLILKSSTEAVRLIEMLFLMSEEELKNLDLEEFRSLWNQAKEWGGLEEKCRIWPDYPTPGYYLGQLKTFLESLKKQIAKAGESPAQEPFATFGRAAAFEGRLAVARSRLQDRYNSMSLALARGEGVDAKERERTGSAVDALNRVFNGAGKPLTPAALFDVVQAVPKDSLSDDEWALLARHFPMGEDILRHQAMDVWRSGATGKGVKIAVIDEGVDPKHPAFRRPFLASISKSVVRQKKGDKAGTIDMGGSHGTAVASSALALAPEADLIAIKLFPSGHEGVSSGDLPPELKQDEVFEKSMINALEEAVKQGAQVVSISVYIGGEPFVPNAMAPQWNKIVKKIQEVVANGVVVVYAAGNSGANFNKAFQEGRLLSPAALPEVIAVGAVDYFGKLAKFSSHSKVNDPDSKQVYEKPDVSSYGVDMRVAKFDKAANYAGGENNLFDTGSGTSFATPQVAGIAALAVQKLREQGKNSVGSLVRRLILETATKPDECLKTGGCDDAGYGRGIVSLKGIMDRILPPAPQTVVPTVVKAPGKRSQ